MIVVIFILCGLLTGLLGGMLGIGGGVISVPALYFLFEYLGLFDSKAMQVAASTSLAISFLISSLSSLVQYHKRAISFLALKFLAPGLILGCILGALLAHLVSSDLLRNAFGVVALLIGIYFILPALPQPHIATLPNRSLSLFGILIGTLSSMLGLGGGILTFPTLLSYGLEPKTSSGTSSGATALSTLFGTLTYLTLAPSNLPGAIGYIDIQAFWITGVVALFTTPIGVRLSHTASTHHLRRIFGASLCLTGLIMLFLYTENNDF